MTVREVKKILKAQATSEGAGVKLKRGFGGTNMEELDPFLLFDDFSSPESEDFIAGFPWHPHRGMETVTYILDGEVEHKDSIGNEGSIGAGDVQWMSAGSGIIHQEMPQARANGIRGFQLWVNLPKSEKMSAPKYRDISRTAVPLLEDHGIRVRAIAGTYNEQLGAVTDVAGSPTYLDITLEKGSVFDFPVASADTVLFYIIEGMIEVGTLREKAYPSDVVITQKGDTVHLESPQGDSRFFLMAGTPLNEPVAWYGPIVMNTKEEIQLALSEFHSGIFIK